MPYREEWESRFKQQEEELQMICNRLQDLERRKDRLTAKTTSRLTPQGAVAFVAIPLLWLGGTAGSVFIALAAKCSWLGAAGTGSAVGTVLGVIAAVIVGGCWDDFLPERPRGE